MRKLSFFLILLFIGTAICYYKNCYGFYALGEGDSFKIKVGETFKIKLNENGSTGYANCWLNEAELKAVKMVKKEYEQGYQSKLGYDGSGGTLTLTFQGMATGHGIIKLASCPIGPEQKNCAAYTTANTKADNEFLISVVK
jgi:predicted secreted protein